MTKKELENKIEILEDMISDLSYLITNHIGESTNSDCNITKKDCYNKIMCSNCKWAMYDLKNPDNKNVICYKTIECGDFEPLEISNTRNIKINNNGDYATISQLDYMLKKD